MAPSLDETRQLDEPARRPRHRGGRRARGRLRPALDARARRADERGGRDRARGRGRGGGPDRRRDRGGRGARSRAAAAWSTSAPERPAGSRRSTRPSARRRSPSPGKVVALVAGGRDATPLERGGGGRRGRRAPTSRALELAPDDVVVGVSASGRTPYVVAALEAAAQPGRATACVVSVAGSELEAARRAPDRRRRRPRVPRRLDPAQGGHRAEARPEHALDRLDDPARQDVRQPHGRRRRDEREAAGARAADRRDATGAVAGGGRRRARRRRTATRRSRSSRSSPASTPTRPARGSSAPGRASGRRSRR